MDSGYEIFNPVRNPHLLFALYPEAEWLKVQFLRAGAPVKDHSYTLRVHYQEASGSEKSRAARVAGIEGTVVEEKGEARLRLRMQSGSVIWLSVDVDQQNTLQFRYGIDSMADGYPIENTWMQVGMEMPALLEFDVDKDGAQESPPFTVQLL